VEAVTGDIIQDLTSILEEASPHSREVIERAIEEIQKQRETISTLTKDTVETLNASIETLRAIHPGKNANTFFIESQKMVENATHEDRPFVALARVRAAAATIRYSPPATYSMEAEGPDSLRYDTKTLNQKRAEALAAHIRQTGKTSIKSTEARTVLETVEHRKLDRKTVWRALRAAQGILRATVDKIGVVSRLVLSSPSHPPRCTPPDGLDGRHDIGEGGGMPRPRIDRVLWDG
jgi:hypothetical protein